MEIVRDIKAMRQRCADLRQAGRSLAFVPTMGYLHKGHLALLEEGRSRGDVLILSIFVNPTQFGAGEDFGTYPRDFERDADLARKAGTDLLFAPGGDDIYPGGFATTVSVSGLTETLCGRSRPGHFAGVTTVVAKLFNIVQPHLALFGRKDFQQLTIIRRMVRDLDMGIKVIGLPTVRDSDGLAMSSRNVHLPPGERRQARAIPQSLLLAVAKAKAGERDPQRLINAVRERISREPDAEIDYVQICHDRTLQDVETVDSRSVLLLAVRIGDTRLIDNHYLLEEVWTDEA